MNIVDRDEHLYFKRIEENCILFRGIEENCVSRR